MQVGGVGSGVCARREVNEAAGSRGCGSYGLRSRVQGRWSRQKDGVIDRQRRTVEGRRWFVSSRL